MSNKSKPKNKTIENKKKLAEQRDLEEKLEEGLEESFPGSDPIAVCEPSPHQPQNKMPK
jgi:hypothetical protein